MTRPDYSFGFRVVGSVAGERVPVDAAAALAGHCAALPEAEPGREAFLSAYRFTTDFDAYVKAHGGTRGFCGSCWSPWLWIDIDRDGNPAAALADARRLVAFILERYPAVDEDDLLVFFSGRKGYHLGLPLAHNPNPGLDFHRTTGRLAAGLAAGAGVKIDTSIYDRVKLFRAPNSRHPATGLHKRRLTHDELMNLTPERIATLATEPAAFELPAPTKSDAGLADDWADAAKATVTARAAATARPHSGRLKRATTDFLREGAAPGERNDRLLEAVADLKELHLTHGPDALIRAVLTEAALDSGLPPAEVARVITNGIDLAARKANGREGGPA